jgi:hypothetical protein
MAARLPLVLPYVVNLLTLVIGPAALFFPQTYGKDLTFSGAWESSEAFRLVGAVVSMFGLVSVLALLTRQYERYSPILLCQWVYKVLWLVTIFLVEPNSVKPPVFTAVSIAYVLLWPFVMPWGYLLGGSTQTNTKHA